MPSAAQLRRRPGRPGHGADARLARFERPRHARPALRATRHGPCRSASILSRVSKATLMWLPDRRLGGGAVARLDRPDDLLVLVERPRAAALGGERGGREQRHRPVHHVELLDQVAVVAGEMDLVVEDPVGLRQPVRLAGEGPVAADEVPEHPHLLGRGVLRGEARGQPLELGAHHVELAELVVVEARDHQAAPVARPAPTAPPAAAAPRGSACATRRSARRARTRPAGRRGGTAPGRSPRARGRRRPSDREWRSASGSRRRVPDRDDSRAPAEGERRRSEPAVAGPGRLSGAPEGGRRTPCHAPPSPTSRPGSSTSTTRSIRRRSGCSTRSSAG